MRWYPGSHNAWTPEMRESFDRWRESPEAKAQAEAGFTAIWGAAENGTLEVDVLRSPGRHEKVIVPGPPMNRKARRAAKSQRGRK